jgi:hypothetical protein
MSFPRQAFRTGILAVLILMAAAQSRPFVRDTHYYLGFAAALATCFDWDEAHLIASANLMVDGNTSTRAEWNPLQKHAKTNWHAFGHSKKRYNELWYRVLDEKDPNLQLILLGKFLHVLPDWGSHARFSRSLGHASATVLGKDPDSMARDRQRTISALQATLDHMAQVCACRGRLPEGIEDPDEALLHYLAQPLDDDMIDDMVAASNPRWRKGRTGGLNKLGRAILEHNVDRVEEYIEEWIKPIPGKKVPADFSATDPDHGIPPAIDMSYDRNGKLLEDLADIVAAAGEDIDEHDDDGDDQLTIIKVKQIGGGWSVKVKILNIGSDPVPAGELVVVASDAMSEEELGVAREPLPALGPGEKAKIKAFVETTRTADETMLSIVAEVEDAPGLNNQVWFMTEDDVRDLEEEYLPILEEMDEVGEDEPIEVGVIGTPKLWFNPNDWLCASILVGTSDKDPTHVLDPIEFSIASANGEATSLAGIGERRWSITATGRTTPPAAKTYECFAPAELCPLIAGVDSPTLLVHAEAGTGEQQVSVPLEGPLGEELRMICATKE